MYLYSSFNLGAKWGWVVNATPRPLYPREIRVTYCVGVWMRPRASMDGFGISRPHWDSIPGPSSPLRVAIPTELSRSVINISKSISLYMRLHKSIKILVGKPGVNTLRTGLLNPLNARSRGLNFRHRASCI